MYKKICITFFITTFIANISFAANPYSKKTEQHIKKSHCIPTHSIHLPLSEQPLEYAQYNNITTSEGDFQDNLSNNIILKGVITDKNCVPISNARITISQKDEYGVFRFVRAFVPIFEKSYKLNYQQYSTFSGTGVAIADNRGRFAFITAIPNIKTKDLNRTINITVEHIDYPDVSTQVFFGNKANAHNLRNKDKFIYAKHNCMTKTINNQNLPVYNINLVLDGISEYKRY
jgi:protocatechuate 3,4-dioxygenase beta subunit